MQGRPGKEIDIEKLRHRRKPECRNPDLRFADEDEKGKTSPSCCPEKRTQRERLDEMGRRREMLSRHQTFNTFLRCSCVPLRPPVSIASGIENRTRLEAGDVVGSYNAAAAAGQGVSRVSTSVREDRIEDSALCYKEGTSREHQTLKGRTAHPHYGTVAPPPRMGICELAVLLSLCLSV